MDRLSQLRPSPAMLVAVVALIAALVGTAIAGVATTSKLDGKEKKQVKKIARHEANKGITRRAPKLSVATAGSAVTANSALTATQLGRVSVQRQTGSVANGVGGSVDAFCPEGTQAIGGGGRGDDFDEPRLLASRPTRAGGEPPSTGESFNGWRVSVFNDTGVTVQPEAWAICVG
jgi:hypothetical protein